MRIHGAYHLAITALACSKEAIEIFSFVKTFGKLITKLFFVDVIKDRTLENGKIKWMEGVPS